MIHWAPWETDFSSDPGSDMTIMYKMPFLIVESYKLGNKPV